MNEKILIYISGKYSGDVEQNIKIARSVSIQLWNAGFAVLCPHLNTQHFEVDCKAEYQDYIDGDLKMINGCDAVLLLPGWEESKGAKLELQHAVDNGKRIFYLQDLSEINDTIDDIKAVWSVILQKRKNKISAVQEAIEIVDGARRQSYGTPLNNHTRTAKLWSTFLGKEVTPEQVCYMNILQKIARSMEVDKRDNIVDVIGYSINIDLIKKEKNEW